MATTRVRRINLSDLFGNPKARTFVTRGTGSTSRVRVSVCARTARHAPSPARVAAGIRPERRLSNDTTIWMVAAPV
jgi:hypothetical protein